MKETVELSADIPVELNGERLDQAAAQLFPEYSRSRLQIWIKSGELCVNGQQRRPKDKVSDGDRLVIEAELVLEVPWQAQDIALDIVYEDTSIIVLNKPAGLVVHPAAGHADGTLVNALLGHAPDLAQLPRAGIVHRLDMDTSGIMVVARSLAAHNHLVAQLQARTVKREYCAVCIGAMTGGGTVDAPMGRHPRQRKKMAVLSAGGKPAITHYRVRPPLWPPHPHSVSHWRPAAPTRYGCTWPTGKYPLVGDPHLRRPPAYPAEVPQAELVSRHCAAFRRQALHAQALGLVHPESGGGSMQFRVPAASRISLTLLDDTRLARTLPSCGQ